MEVKLGELLEVISKDPSLPEISTLHRLVRSREIEDVEDVVLKDFCETIWICLSKCWTSKKYSEKENMTWEIVSWFLTLPSFTSTEEDIIAIGNTISKDFCKKLLTSLERGIEEFDGHGGHLLRWTYLRVPSLRRQLRILLGSRLLSYSQSPDVLKLININPHLRLLGDIIAGVTTFPSSSLSNSDMKWKIRHDELHRHLLLNVILPLHSPNQMIEWRDQIPVLQLYHESLVRCLVRLIEWEKANGDCNEPNKQAVVRTHISNDMTVSQEDKEESLLAPSAVQPKVNKFNVRGTINDKATLLVLTLRVLLESMWPEGFNTNTPKEILFLHEVEKLLEMASPTEFAALLEPVLNRLQVSIMHENVRTIQRALKFFRNEKFLNLIQPHSALVIHRLLPALYRRGQLFWNITVNKMTATVMKKLYDMDAASFEKIAEDVAGNEIPSKRPLPSNQGQSYLARPGRSSTVLSKTSYPQSVLNSVQPSAHVAMPALHQSSIPSLSKDSMRQQMLASASSDRTNPPVTITGVAPWAFQQQSRLVPEVQTHAKVTQHKRKPGYQQMIPPTSSVLPSQSENVTAISILTGFQMVKRYMKRCRISGAGGDPSSGNNDDEIDDDDDDDDEDKPSHWSLDQASVQPKLLPELRFHDLVFGQVLGEGSYGTVKYARQIIKGTSSHRSKCPEYAVKILSSKRLQEMGRDSLRLASREIAALHSLSHPGIARLISAFRYTDGFYLVLEYASQGDLHSYIIQQGRLNEVFTRFIVGEICAALLSIHEMGLAYNDLKPENVLITEVGHVKLSDFGACRAVTSDGKAVLARGNILLQNLRDGDWRDKASPRTYHIDNNELVDWENVDGDIEAEGTPGYLPPEILSQSSAPGWGCDSWALGCLLYFCLVGRPKYFGTTFQEVLDQILSEVESSKARSVHFSLASGGDVEEILDELSPISKQLMNDLMNVDTSTRLTLNGACSHSYFTEANNDFSGSKDDYSLCNMDPRTFHMQQPLKLPHGTGTRLHSQVEDKDWAQRQCSMVWNPIPKEYTFRNESSSTTSDCRLIGSISRIFSALENIAIQETTEESLCNWLP